MKRLLALGACALIALVSSGCLPAASDFQTLDGGLAPGATGWTPDAPQNPSAFSVLQSNRVVDLIWRPRHPNSYLGTALESDSVEQQVHAGDTLSVNYALSSSTPDFINAMPAGGSIRLFAYYMSSTDYTPGNRPNFAPDACTAIAPQGARTGTLTCVLPADGFLGYTGLVYDTSNGGVQGRVRFSDLKINDTLVLFN